MKLLTNSLPMGSSHYRERVASSAGSFSWMVRGAPYLGFGDECTRHRLRRVHPDGTGEPNAVDRDRAIPTGYPNRRKDVRSAAEVVVVLAGQVALDRPADLNRYV